MRPNFVARFGKRRRDVRTARRTRTKSRQLRRRRAPSLRAAHLPPAARRAARAPRPSPRCAWSGGAVAAAHGRRARARGAARAPGKRRLVGARARGGALWFIVRRTNRASTCVGIPIPIPRREAEAELRGDGVHALVAHERRRPRARQREEGIEGWIPIELRDSRSIDRFRATARDDSVGGFRIRRRHISGHVPPSARRLGEWRSVVALDAKRLRRRRAARAGRDAAGGGARASVARTTVCDSARRGLELGAPAHDHHRALFQQCARVGQSLGDAAGEDGGDARERLSQRRRLSRRAECIFSRSRRPARDPESACATPETRPSRARPARERASSRARETPRARARARRAPPPPPRGRPALTGAPAGAPTTGPRAIVASAAIRPFAGTSRV